MRFIFWTCLIVFIIYGILYLIRKYLLKYRFSFNESDMLMFFGLPGSGKSTVCADIVRQCFFAKKSPNKRIPKDIATYCNFPIIGAYSLNRDDIGNVDFRRVGSDHALLLIDEASTVYFKRNAMSKDPKSKFRDSENEFHSMHRHYKTMEVFFAQSWDGVDLRLRELSTGLYYVEPSRIRPFIKIRKIVKIFKIDENSQPIDGYDFEKWSSRYVYAPAAWYLFDTYHAPELPSKVPDEWYPDQYPVRLPRFFRIRRTRAKKKIEENNQDT